MDFKVLYLGDRAVTLEFGSDISLPVSQKVLSLHHIIREQHFPGIIETVPTFRSLTVHYDPLQCFPDDVVEMLTPLIENAGEIAREPRTWIFPCCYEKEFAPDLGFVAKAKGLSEEEVINLHSQSSYTVFMLGFLPGFGFMGEVDDKLVLSRRKEPRKVVPKGAVAIADKMTAVYPSQSPGGWHLIGRTPVEFFDKTPLLEAGDKVCFQPITAKEFHTIENHLAKGDYDVRTECLHQGETA